MKLNNMITSPLRCAASHASHGVFGTAAIIVLASLGSPAFAASTLTTGVQIDLASQNAPASNANYNISVNSAYQGYEGTGVASDGTTLVSTDATFNNPITAYRFWNSPSANTFGTLASSGTIISDMSTTDTTYSSVNGLNLWTTTDPNGNLYSSTADYSGNTGIQGLTDISGTIDISGMSAGTIYFIYGAYRSNATFGVTMTGSGSASDMTIAQIHNGDFANNYESYIASIDFTNDDGFTTIDYDMVWASQFNGRWGGVVVTSVPEPGAALLGALGLLTLLRRRR